MIPLEKKHIRGKVLHIEATFLLSSGALNFICPQKLCTRFKKLLYMKWRMISIVFILKEIVDIYTYR